MEAQHLFNHLLSGVTWTRTIPTAGSAAPRHTCTESGPLRRHLNLALPFCLFSTMGTTCRGLVFRTGLPLLHPQKPAECLHSLEIVPVSWHGGLPWALTAISRIKERQSLSVAQAQRIQKNGDLPSTPVPHLHLVRGSLWASVHRRGPISHRLLNGLQVDMFPQEQSSKIPGNWLRCEGTHL